MALWYTVCYTVRIPQGLRESTPVEAASGRDMTVSDWVGLPIQRWSAQESPGVGHGERSMRIIRANASQLAAARCGARRPASQPTRPGTQCTILPLMTCGVNHFVTDTLPNTGKAPPKTGD